MTQILTVVLLVVLMRKGHSVTTQAMPVILDIRWRTTLETGKFKQNNDLKIRLIHIVKLDSIEAF